MDAELARSWKSGDVEAGRVVLERHVGSVHRYFVAKVDRSTADDLTHDTFVLCLESFARFEGRGCLRAFIFGIARNRLFKYLRHRERERRAMAVQERSIPEPACVPWVALNARYEHDVLSRSLRCIPPDLQVLIELYYWEDRPLGDIARVLEIPVGTVKSRLSRARARVRAAYDRQSESGPPPSRGGGPAPTPPGGLRPQPESPHR